MSDASNVSDWIGVGVTIGGVVTFGYWLYLNAVRKSLEDRMDVLSQGLGAALTEFREGLATKVDKEDQRLIDADLKREIGGVREELTELRKQTHTDSMAVVQSIGLLQTTLTNAITEALRSK